MLSGFETTQLMRVALLASTMREARLTFGRAGTARHSLVNWTVKQGPGFGSAQDCIEVYLMESSGRRIDNAPNGVDIKSGIDTCPRALAGLGLQSKSRSYLFKLNPHLFSDEVMGPHRIDVEVLVEWKEYELSPPNKGPLGDNPEMRLFHAGTDARTVPLQEWESTHPTLSRWLNEVELPEDHPMTGLIQGPAFGAMFSNN